jgi:archaellum component FlaC
MPRTDVELNNLKTMIFSLNINLQSANNEIERLKKYIQLLDETYILIKKNSSGETRIRY